MSENFDRQYRLYIGDFEVGGGNFPLHVKFDIEKADTTSKNTAKISVWNLNDAHLATLNTADCKVVLRAGYGTHLAQIFTGTISFVSTSMDGADRQSDIELVDSLVSIRDSYISLSYNGKVSWKQIFDDVANQMGLTVTYSYNATYADISNGYSYVGKAEAVIQKGCNCCNLTWTIQNGVLQILQKNDVMSKQCYVISPSTGMVNIPSKVAIEKSDNTVKKVGWDVQFLLNGAIGVNDYVRVESSYLTGYFKVYSITHSGDNVSGDWISTARLVEIS